MKNLYRHYRQVKVFYGDGDKPQVQGYEEIWNNGEKQVRRWTDNEDLISLPIDTSDLFDFGKDAWIGLELPITESGDWLRVDSFNSSPRYLKCKKRTPATCDLNWSS